MVLVMLKYFRDLFFVCNSGAYSEKEDYFYPLKDKLLKKHGKPDGYDLQVIDHKCCSCDGEGYLEFSDNSRELCEDCEGTGIYKTARVILSRYILGKRIYHIPSNDYALLDESAPKSTINGFIAHDDIDREAVLRALKILLFRYDFPQFYSLMYELYRERKEGEAVYWHRFEVSDFVDRLFFTSAILLSGAMPYWDNEAVEALTKDYFKYKWLSWVLSPHKRYMRRHYLQLRCVRFKMLARLGLYFTGWKLDKYNANGLWCRYVAFESFSKYIPTNVYSLNHYQWILNAYKKDKRKCR